MGNTQQTLAIIKWQADLAVIWPMTTVCIFEVLIFPLNIHLMNTPEPTVLGTADMEVCPLLSRISN